MILLTNKTNHTISLLKTLHCLPILLRVSVLAVAFKGPERSILPFASPSHSHPPSALSLSSEANVHWDFALAVPAAWNHLPPVCTWLSSFPFSGLSSDITFSKRLSPTFLFKIYPQCTLLGYLFCDIFCHRSFHYLTYYTFDIFFCIYCQVPDSPTTRMWPPLIEELWNALFMAVTSASRIVLDT